jgi:hypothetical protein
MGVPLVSQWNGMTAATRGSWSAQARNASAFATQKASIYQS